ncbi:CocE/NonD family hydrolase [Natronoglycomyces albus]|uniref:Xaa-Pro dipeptidyl-peptidase C-terminal domain-containing protein n=1 Tax=Natronoglycomyces albus TaxID=2811108 RepID=A0A895XTA3_9ACTN|nr:CocE/NonD family hydrolase [Natronoglycomyces albus]QSB04868.1 hypothetical protein JQS30_14035 [Natronoglycomyces albus]
MTPRKSRSLLAAALAGSLVVTGWTANALAQPHEQPNPENLASEPTHSMDDAIYETVFVESSMDSDGDGQLDRIAVEIVRPAATEQGLEVPVIAQPSPYYDLSTAQIAMASEYNIPIDPNMDPRHFSGWFHDYFVPRGYAYIEPEMQGTAQSDGCPTTGGVEDTESIVAVVDWLAGRTSATYADGSEAVADWAEPSVGMIGTSYNGTLPNAVAATGIDEVKAIVPVAAISSWYDYTRAEGIGLRGWDSGYVKWLANYVANPEARQACQGLWDHMVEDADDVTYDYNDFWAERDYLNTAHQVHAGVLHVHGQSDFNVNTTHTGRWWEELAQHDVEQKLWLHPGAHVDPTGSAAGRELVHAWFDHFLKGIDNGILDEPDVIVDRGNQSDPYDNWPNPAGEDITFYLGEGADGVGTLGIEPSATGTHTVSGSVSTEAQIVSNPAEIRDNRRVFLSEPVQGPQHLSGIVEVDLTFTSSTSSTALSAVLVSYDPAGNAEFITYNGADGKNYESLSAQQPLVPGQTYAMNFQLEPRDVIIPDGHRIGLALVTNHPTLTTNDPLSDVVDFHLQHSTLDLNLTSLS